MAQKQGMPLYGVVEAQQTVTVDLEIAGAWLVDSGDGKVTVRVSDVKETCVEWERVEQVLKDAGIEQGDVEFLCNGFANTVELHMLVRALASRTKRVG